MEYGAVSDLFLLGHKSIMLHCLTSPGYYPSVRLCHLVKPTIISVSSSPC